MAEKHRDQMRPTVESFTAFIRLLLFDQLLENWPVNLFNNLRKQSNITHERPEVLVQTQSTYFGQKVRSLIPYLGRYCVSISATNRKFISTLGVTTSWFLGWTTVIAIFLAII
jgi:hypothetical protein